MGTGQPGPPNSGELVLGKDQPSAKVHYYNIFEYLIIWSEVQFLNIRKSKNLINLDFTPETSQKIENMLILNSRYRGMFVV